MREGLGDRVKKVRGLRTINWKLHNRYGDVK